MPSRYPDTFGELLATFGKGLAIIAILFLSLELIKSAFSWNSGGILVFGIVTLIAIVILAFLGWVIQGIRRK
jgi:type IV secretory pathway VirB2 component (pilin)